MRISTPLLVIVLFLSIGITTNAQSKRKKKEMSLAKMQESEYYFTDGMKEYTVENYSKAISAFQRAYELTPDNAGLNYMIAEGLQRTDELEKAEKYSLKAIEVDETNKYYYIQLAHIYEQRKKYAESVKVYQKMIKKIPHTEQYLYDLADMQLNAKDYDEAIKTYDKAESIFGKNEDVVRQKQKLYLRTNKLEDAINEGNKLITSFPDDIRFQLQQAELLIANKKSDEALFILNKIIAQNPNEPYSRLLMFDIYRLKNQQDKALEQLLISFKNPTLDIDSKISILYNYLPEIQKNNQVKSNVQQLGDILTQVHPKEAKSFSINGDILFLSDNKKEALVNYSKATKLDNSKYKIWQQIISIEAELNLIDSLVLHSSQALELFPTQSIFWFYNGTAHLQKKNYPQAIESLEQGKKIAKASNPEMVIQFNAQLGDSYNGAKNYKKSDEAFEAVLKSDPNNSHVMNNYSYFLSLRKEKIEEAKKWGKILVEKHPDESTYLDTYGWILYVAQEYEEAKKYLEKAAKGSDNGTILEHYGDVLFKLGKKDEALELWKKAKKQGEVSELIDKKIADKNLYE